jgi:hypothetical protein
LGVMTGRFAKAGDDAALEGKPAPQRFAQNAGGQGREALGPKGSVVLMDFWATWCLLPQACRTYGS